MVRLPDFTNTNGYGFSFSPYADTTFRRMYPVAIVTKTKRQVDPRIARLRSIKRLNTSLQSAYASLELAKMRTNMVYSQIENVLKETDSDEERAFLESLITIRERG